MALLCSDPCSTSFREKAKVLPVAKEALQDQAPSPPGLHLLSLTLAHSTPALLVSSLYLKYAMYVPASGPLHRLSHFVWITIPVRVTLPGVTLTCAWTLPGLHSLECGQSWDQTDEDIDIHVVARSGCQQSWSHTDWDVDLLGSHTWV